MARLCLLACLLALPALAPSGAAALERLEDIACTSPSACVAVGLSDAEDGSAQASARDFDGAEWAALELPVPEGATVSRLHGVSCAGAEECVAIGSFFDPEAEATMPLAIARDEGGWEIEEVPLPAGAISGRLADLACTGEECLAVGSFTDAEEVTKPLALGWEESQWSLLEAPVPSGASRSELAGVSCTEADDCVAVGSFVNSAEVTKTLAMVWNGSGFAINSTPEPAESELNQLQDVSCRPSDACTAVGTYFDGAGEQKTLALRRNVAKEWSIQATPNQSGALSNELTAVSCPTGSSCFATGIAEHGSKRVPIAIEWDGESWASQPIDTEALGASAVKLGALACASTEQCMAVGAVAYGRSAADRNLAYAWNGTVWLVSEAGEYERGWLRLDASTASSDLAAVSCPGELRCLAAGARTGDDGVTRSQVGSWSGEDWSASALPQPEGASDSALAGISCATASACKAVGRYTDEEGTHPLARSWSGEQWSIQATPEPEGSSSAELAAVACAASDDCAAVGSYLDLTGMRQPLAMGWNGSQWSLTAVAGAEGAEQSWLTSVSCPAQGCVAVGVKADAFGHRQGFSAIRDEEGTWSEAAIPELEGALPNTLEGVSCPSAEACVAVGGYVDPVGEAHLLALSWDGEAWGGPEVPVIEGDELYIDPEEAEEDAPRPFEQLTSVSCIDAEECVAVGPRPADSQTPPLLVRYDGEGWSEEPAAEIPPGVTHFGVSAVDCHSASRCMASGAATYGTFPPKSYTLSYRDGLWSVPYLPAPGGGLRGASCSSAEHCLAVGDSIDPAGDPATAWSLGEEGWEAQPTAAVSGAFLTDVSCSAPAACAAIGRQGPWPYSPLVERYDGEGWSVEAPPAPFGRSASPEAISCPSESFCLAAGFTWPATGGGPPAILLQRFAAGQWSIEAVSLPSGAGAARLDDLACVSSSFCMAAGTYTDAADAQHGLIVRWNGSGFTSSAIDPPEDHSYRLKGIDCTSATACTAVGVSVAQETNAHAPIAYRYDGSAWSAQEVPAPQGIGGSLSAVECFSSTRCVAGGNAIDPASERPLLIGWRDGAWAEEPSPRVPGASSTRIEDISCFSAADCTAVGIAQFTDGPREPLVIKTEGEDPESEDPVAVAGGAVPRLSPEQEEAALEILDEDPALQAAIGSAEYEAKVGIWTELDEEAEEETVVGATFELTLQAPEGWEERSWPITVYELGANGYEGGLYEPDALDAAASAVQVLDVNLDLAFDEEGMPVEGEVVEVMPAAVGPAQIEVDPEGQGEYDPDVARY